MSVRPSSTPTLTGTRRGGGGGEALPGKEKPAAKRAFSQPVTRYQAIFSQFPLSPLTLRLIGRRCPLYPEPFWIRFMLMQKQE
jgi:hypothetical protein